MRIRVKSLWALFFLAACTPNKDQLQKVIEENPEIVFGAIEKNPDRFMGILEKASSQAQQRAQENAQKEEQARMDEEAKNPLKPALDPDRAYFGPETAAVTIVEYTDFECPYCKKGNEVLNQVKKAYGDKVRVLYKSLPLDFHPLAMPAAQRFEAIALQSAKKAYVFHDLVFDSQNKLASEGEKFLDAMVKKSGADLTQVKKDMNSEKVKARIAADMEEAARFGIRGTPGFVINGTSVRGAYPFETFKEIIDKNIK
jgi:protein-disulfide isomerase